MSKQKYVKLTSSQKLEIVKFWEENHCPYHTIATHYSQKWGQNIRTSTVADIVNYWRKWKTVRGASKASTQNMALNECVVQSLLLSQNLGLRISKECIHAVCMGELSANDETLPLQSIEKVLEENNLEDSPALWRDQTVDVQKDAGETLSLPSASSDLFLDSLSLFWRCAPYRPFCYDKPLSNPAYRDQVNALVVYSADGTYRTPPFLYGHEFSTLLGENWTIVKKKPAAAQSIQSQHAEALLHFLEWLDSNLSESHLLLFDNASGLIASIEEEGPAQRVFFASSSIVLHRLRLSPLLRLSLRSPFTRGIHRLTKIAYRWVWLAAVMYRTLLLEKLVALQVNHRGYKRLLAVEDCATLLAQAWEQIPNSFIANCVCMARSIPAAEDSELPLIQARDRFDAAFNTFYSLFSIREEDRVSADSYLHLEACPFVGGMNALRECVIDPSSRHTLFNHAGYPECPSSSMLTNQQRDKVLPVEIETPSDVAFLEAFPFPPSMEGQDLFYSPTPEVVHAFCACLDSFLSSGSYSVDDLDYFASFKERLLRQYC